MTRRYRLNSPFDYAANKLLFHCRHRVVHAVKLVVCKTVSTSQIWKKLHGIVVMQWIILCRVDSGISVTVLFSSFLGGIALA